MMTSLLNQAQASVQLGEFGQAKTLLLDHLAVAPQDGQCLALLGIVLLFLQEPDNAVGYLRKAVAAVPDNPSAQYYLGYACMLTGDVASAIAAFRSVPESNTLALDAHNALTNLEQHQLVQDCNRFEQATGEFVTYHLRPLQSQYFGLQPDTPSLSRQLAIIIQGPVLLDNNFTLETVRLYRKLFPHSIIVVSTWDDEADATVQMLEASGAVVLKNAKPTKAGALLPGISNINMQICSTAAGVSFAAAHGYRYTLKTRTDFRIHNTSFLANALTLLAAYPLQTTTSQRERLLAFSDVIRYMPYAVPDKNLFGNTLDMLDYWSAPYDERPGPSPGTLMGMARFGVGESYLLTRYMALLGRPLDWTFADSWSVLRDHFVFMDQSAADMFWHKYQRHREFRWQQYARSTTFQDFGFSEWLRLYVGRVPMVGDARIGELGGGVSVEAILAEYNRKAID